MSKTTRGRNAHRYLLYAVNELEAIETLALGLRVVVSPNANGH